MIKFEIPGVPQPKQRPRVLKNGVTYTPKETVIYEELVRACCNAGVFYEKDIPLRLTVRAYFGIPKSWSKAKKEDALSGMLFMTSRPDIDNLEKIIADGLNGYLYYDDSQIVESITSKYYADIPRVEVTVETIQEVRDKENVERKLP